MRFERGLDALQEGMLCVLLLMLPFSKAAVEIGFGVLFLTWIAQRLHPGLRRGSLWVRPEFRGSLVAMAAFLGACALSVVTSTDPVESVEGFIGKWAEYVLFGVLVAEIAARPVAGRRAIVALGCSAALVLLEAAVQELTGRGLFSGHQLVAYGRMTGPYENPGDLAAYLIFMIPLALAGATSARRFRPVWLLLLVGLVVCVGRAESTGAWIGLIAGLSFSMLWYGTIRQSAPLVAAVLAAGTFWAHQTGRLTRTFSMADPGWQDRLVMWKAAIGMIRDRPVLGQGVNTFMANYLRFWVGGEQAPRYAHNCYLQMAAETGLLGLGAFLAMLWLALRRVHESIVAVEGERRAWLVGFLASLVAFLVQAGLDTNFYALRQAALFFIGLGLAWGLGAQPPARSACPS